MGAAYYRALERLVLPYTYWGWKFIAGSVGYRVERPWTAKLCYYFWPAFSLLWSPISAFIFFSLWGPFWGFVALLLVPPVFTIAVLSWILRLTIGPPFVRFVNWLFTSERVKFVAGVMTLVFLVAVIVLGGTLLLFELWNNVGWFTPLIILGFVVVAALCVFLVIVLAMGAEALGGKIKTWADSRPPRPKREKRELPAPLRAIVRFGLGVLRLLGAILGLLSFPFYLLYAFLKQFCPVMTYPVFGSSDDSDTVESA